MCVVLTACGESTSAMASPSQATAKSGVSTLGPERSVAGGVAAPASRSSGPSRAAANEATAYPAYSVAPSKLPGGATLSWTAQPTGPLEQVVGHSIELNECATVQDASTWQQQSYMSSGGNSAILETFAFASNSAAASAFASVDAGMDSCQSVSRALQNANHAPQDAVCLETASEPSLAAFERKWTGVQGISAAGPQINHLYFAQRGATLLVLHFDEFTAGTDSAARYDVQNDPSVLSMLESVLATPSGSR
jgi:hypothetical protein